MGTPPATTEGMIMRIYSAEEFARVLGCSPRRVRRLAQLQRIYPARKVGRSWVFQENSTIIRSANKPGYRLSKIRVPHEDSSQDLLRDLDSILSNPGGHNYGTDRRSR